MISTVVFNWLVPQWWKEGLGIEPRSPKSLSFYHCLPLEGRLWNRCQRCSFPDWEAGGNCLCKRQLVRKKSKLDWVPRQLTLADPHGVASCHHPGLDRAGCVLQRHASQNSLSGFTTVHPNSLARAVTWQCVLRGGARRQETQDPFSWSKAELRGLLSSGRVGSGQKVCLMIKPGGEERKKSGDECGRAHLSSGVLGQLLKQWPCLWPRVYQSIRVSPAVDSVFGEGPSVIPQKGFNISEVPLYVFSYHPLSSPVKWAGPREVKLLFQNHTAGKQCPSQLSSIPCAMVCAPRNKSQSGSHMEYVRLLQSPSFHLLGSDHYLCLDKK